MTPTTTRRSDAASVYKTQRSALTRAIRSDDPAKVVDACRAAVAQWNDPSLGWPDDWTKWERALLDAFPWPPPYASLDDLVS